MKHGWISIVILGVLFAATGCRSERAIWHRAYVAKYDEGFQVGWKKGETAGRKVTKSDGLTAAKIAASKGIDWDVYSSTIWFGLVLGCLTGIAVQYVALMIFADARKLSTFVMVVPGIRHSKVYAYFESRQQQELSFHQKRSEIEHEKRNRILQMQAAHEARVAQIRSASTLDELRHVRIVEVAEKDLQNVVAEVERDLSLRSATCPACGNTFTYNTEQANSLIDCPADKCDQSIRLPPL